MRQKILMHFYGSINWRNEPTGKLKICCTPSRIGSKWARVNASWAVDWDPAARRSPKKRAKFELIYHLLQNPLPRRLTAWPCNRKTRPSCKHSVAPKQTQISKNFPNLIIHPAHLSPRLRTLLARLPVSDYFEITSPNGTGPPRSKGGILPQNTKAFPPPLKKNHGVPPRPGKPRMVRGSSSLEEAFPSSPSAGTPLDTRRPHDGLRPPLRAFIPLIEVGV